MACTCFSRREKERTEEIALSASGRIADKIIWRREFGSILYAKQGSQYLQEACRALPPGKGSRSLPRALGD